MIKKIKNSNPGNLGTYIGTAADADGKPLEREHLIFAGGAVTEIDDKKLAEACKDPIVRGWFEDLTLIDLSNAPGAPAPAPEAKAASVETKAGK